MPKENGGEGDVTFDLFPYVCTVIKNDPNEKQPLYIRNKKWKRNLLFYAL
jgi:hypothetical protein